MFEFRLPDLGEGIHEGELLKWYIEQGDQIQEDDPLCDMETDKAAVTIPCPRTGIVSSLKARPGDTVNVGQVFVVIDDGTGVQTTEPRETAEKETAEKQTVESGEQPRQEAVTEKRVIAAPATRRMARQMGIDIKTITGTGPGGRITPEDLTAQEPAGDAPDLPMEIDSQPASAGLWVPFFEPAPLTTFDGPVERIPIRSLRKKTAVKTTTSSIMVPHVAHMDEIDVTQIEDTRRNYNERHGEEGKLTLLAFVVKAVASGLKAFPMFNASVDTAAGDIVHKLYYNIGFAADTPRGLMVPVIHDADRGSLAETGVRIRHLAKKARAGDIEVNELTHGTFSITNVGAIGGTHVFPIINTPETAILGLGRVEKKPVVLNDEIVIRKMLPVTLCFDHRAADGAQAAAFVKNIKSVLEDHLVFMAQV